MEEKPSERWVRCTHRSPFANDILILVVGVPTVILGILFPYRYIVSYELLIGAQKYVLAIIWMLVLLIWFERNGSARLAHRLTMQVHTLQQQLAEQHAARAALLEKLLLEDPEARQPGSTVQILHFPQRSVAERPGVRSPRR
jgi:hypothetical protein